MHWVIQENLYNEDGFNTLIRALEVAQLPYSVHKIIPFSHELTPEPEIQTPKVIVVGAYTMIKIAQERGWTPGAYMNQNFSYRVQIEKWGHRMLNWDAWFSKLGDIYPQQHDVFVRPVNDSKSLAGDLMSPTQLLNLQEGLRSLELEDTFTTLSTDTEVMVASPKTILSEYRTWVVGGRVITASQYKAGGRPQQSMPVPDEVVEFAQSTVREWDPAPAYCLDVCYTPDGLAVVEVNCINAAGFYRADVFKLVQAIEDMES
jgi:hypothetical protein